MLHDAAIAGQSDSESALVRALAFTKRLVEALPVGVLYLDASGTITYENPAMRQIMGVSPGTPSPVVGQLITEVVTIRSTELLPLLARCQAGETLNSYVTRYISLTGRSVDIEVSAAPLMGPTGTWQGAIVMVRDVTDQRQAEAQTRDRLRELTLLYETSAAVSTSLDVDTVLHTTAHHISAALHVDGCAISLWDPDQDAVVTLLDYVRVSGAWKSEPAGTIYPLDQFSRWRRVLVECRSFVFRIDDPDIDPGARAWMEAERMQALLVVPLVVRGGAIGYIELMVQKARTFTPAEISLCETLANHAAAALENARLHGETERRLAEQIALREAATAISSALDLETVLARITEQMGRTVDATSAYICSYDPATETSTVLAEYIGQDALVPERISDMGGAYYEEDKVFLETMSAGRHFVFDLEDPNLTRADRAHMEMYAAKTVLHIPMRLHGALVGYLELWESRKRRVFTPAEIALCQDLAQHAVIALEHARLYEQAQAEIVERRRAEDELRHRNRELAVLNRVIVTSARSEEIEPILETACSELAGAFGLPHASATLLDREKRVTVAVVWGSGDTRPAPGTTLAIADSLTYRHLARNQQEIALVGSVADDPLWPPDTASLLLVPLLVEGELAGSLGLSSNRARPFAPHEIRLAQRAADQVAGSLLRARLRHEHAYLAEQLRQAQKMEALGQMAGGIAHDFNNLLTVISSTTGLLEHELHADDPAREHVRWIREAGERASRLTQQLLRFSRQEVVEPRIVSLNHALSGLQPMLARLAGPSIAIEVRQAPALWPVRIDPSHVDQVLLNLVVNARAAMPDGGRLTIETENVTLDAEYVGLHLDSRLGEHVLLSVTDTGEGITPDVREHLFEPFFTTREGGTGLGLATVYGIVRQNDGHITVDTEVGGGTRFYIYLPRAVDAVRSQDATPEHVAVDPSTVSGAQPAGPVPTPLVGAPDQCVILLVEDEPALRSLATAILRDHGYRVLVAPDGLEALQMSRQHAGNIDLLLTDLVMPRMNGQQLARMLAIERPGIQVVFMSGYPDQTISSQANPAYLRKPFTVEALVQQVEQATSSS